MSDEPAHPGIPDTPKYSEGASFRAVEEDSDLGLIVSVPSPEEEKISIDNIKMERRDPEESELKRIETSYPISEEMQLTEQNRLAQLER